ncbi:BMT2 [Candida margitis]|uniref:BMT2 n=1 Tax=Candida margitis TaxID=1775924 RepID=UPI0022277A84|nr:BMT2 [Candida margitis]KAI5954161.1 BMT2 [Candida margitis]
MAKTKNAKRGLSVRSTSITGKTGLAKQKNLKPEHTRQIIRRFHILQKNKHTILTRLGISAASVEDQNYDSIRKEGLYQTEFKNFKVPAKYSDNEVYRIDSGLTKSDLTRVLARIDSEIEQRGGIDVYQSASTQGQNGKRGGDSSKKLVEWLRLDGYQAKLQNVNALEIGCLSPNNVISIAGIFSSVCRIDLNSQDPAIEQQDFMQRPIPTSEAEKFNLISCSLVINFVPSHKERGDMLVRMTKFLKKPKNGSLSSLFLVLPLPCISNSRYFDNDRLLEIMSALGFVQTYSYEAKKVAYWLFDWNGKTSKNAKFPKKELHSGSQRNNFCITL